MNSTVEYNQSDTTHRSDSKIALFGKLFNRYRINHKNPQYLKNLRDGSALYEDITKFINSLEDENSSNIASMKYLTKMPLRFTHHSLEKLYALNINELMQARIITLGFTMLVLTLLIWPLSVLTFKNSDAWADDYFVLILFHVFMGFTTLLYALLIIIAMSNIYYICEIISLISFSFIITIWGIWHFIAGIFLKDYFDNSLIRGISASSEAIDAFNFIYGILPIIALDTILPTRIIYTWWIHLSFILIYSFSLITFCVVNYSYVPISYTIIRILAYLSIAIMLLIGSYSTELQSRVNFFNSLITYDKILQLESQLKCFKKKSIATPAEHLVDRIKKCTELSRSLEFANKGHNQELDMSLQSVTDSLKECLDLIFTSNLYSVPINDMPNDAQNVINAYVTNKPNKNEMEKFQKSQTKIIKHQNLVQKYHNIVIKRNYTTDDLNSVNGNENILPFEEVKHGTMKLRKCLNQLKPLKPLIPGSIDASILSNWNFNILHHFSTHSDPFTSVAHFMLSDFFNHTKIEPNIALSFLRLVESLYNNTSYHNKMHGLMVAQKMACLANFVGIYNKMNVLDWAAFIVAGLCHDIAHPGRNNAFFINNIDSVAILFNDSSVLENFHASCTFKVLEMPEANIFQNLSKKDFTYCRSRIISLILATDTADHFEIISRFRLLLANSEKKMSQETLLATQKMIIKAADLSSSAMLWDESLEWVQRLLIEFYAQGDDEAALGLPISPLCDRKMHDEVAKSQVSFIKFVVLPLYEQLEEIEDEEQGKRVHFICMKNLNDNIAIWEQGFIVPALDEQQYKCNPASVDLELLMSCNFNN